MLNKSISLLALLSLAACNNMAIRPHSLDKTEKVYVDTNGERIRMALKNELETRGYNVTVGTKTQVENINYVSKEPNAAISTTKINGARYVATVHEYPVNQYMIVLGRFPVCTFNGWTWWDFSVSIADNQTGKEILNWSGMGCKGTVLNQLKDVIDELEK